MTSIAIGGVSTRRYGQKITVETRIANGLQLLPKRRIVIPQIEDGAPALPIDYKAAVVRRPACYLEVD